MQYRAAGKYTLLVNSEGWEAYIVTHEAEYNDNADSNFHDCVNSDRRFELYIGMRENENIIETLDDNLQSTSGPGEYIAMSREVLFCTAPHGDKTMGGKLSKLLAHQFLV